MDLKKTNLDDMLINRFRWDTEKKKIEHEYESENGEENNKRGWEDGKQLSVKNNVGSVDLDWKFWQDRQDFII